MKTETTEKIKVFPGDRVGSWLVLRCDPGVYAFCRCDCGIEKNVNKSHLRLGVSMRCIKCGHKIRAAKLRGAKFTNISTWRTWNHMKQRCHNPDSDSYHKYGARGITVCDRWRASFDAFLADMGPRPSGMSIERIDNDRNYEPSNCKWATPIEQGNNTRRNRILEINGEKKTVTEWARSAGLMRSCIQSRLIRGWKVNETILKPSKYERNRRTNTVA